MLGKDESSIKGRQRAREMKNISCKSKLFFWRIAHVTSTHEGARCAGNGADLRPPSCSSSFSRISGSDFLHNRGGRLDERMCA